MLDQSIIDALDEAGRLMAPVLQTVSVCDGFRASLEVRESGQFSFHQLVGRDENHRLVSAYAVGPSLSEAFAAFLAKRAEKLAEVEKANRERAEFEAWKREREEQVA